MTLIDLLSPSRALCGLEGSSKKRILEITSQIIAEQHPELEADAVFSGLINRERLGSTGIGEGVAVPHCRLSNCRQAAGYLIKLDSAIDFDAIDNKPVDLLFVLVVPEEACDEHLSTLGSIAENMAREEFRAALRNTNNSDALYQAVADNLV